MEHKVLVVSDSHGNFTRLNKIYEHEKPVSTIVHCGDGVGDLFHVPVSSGVRVITVTGNVDLGRGYDMERIVVSTINGVKVMVTHGDIYRVQNGCKSLYDAGREHEVDVVLFGHTHKQYIKEGRPVLFNPGTVSHGFYGILTIGNGIELSHHSLDRAGVRE